MLEASRTWMLYIYFGNRQVDNPHVLPATGTALLALALHPEEHGKRAEAGMWEEG